MSYYVAPENSGKSKSTEMNQPSVASSSDNQHHRSHERPSAVHAPSIAKSEYASTDFRR